MGTWNYLEKNAHSHLDNKIPFSTKKKQNKSHWSNVKHENVFT